MLFSCRVFFSFRRFISKRQWLCLYVFSAVILDSFELKLLIFELFSPFNDIWIMMMNGAAFSFFYCCQPIKQAAKHRSFGSNTAHIVHTYQCPLISNLSLNLVDEQNQKHGLLHSTQKKCNNHRQSIYFRIISSYTEKGTTFEFEVTLTSNEQISAEQVSSIQTWMPLPKNRTYWTSVRFFGRTWIYR